MKHTTNPDALAVDTQKLGLRSRVRNSCPTGYWHSSYRRSPIDCCMGMRLAPAKPFYNSIKGKKKKSYKYCKLLLFLYFKFTFSIRLMAT
jgi:hypothetical protein